MDEAAENLDKAQGAFVWLSPSACEVLDAYPYRQDDEVRTTYLRHSVPMKGGDVVSTYVVSPFNEVHGQEEQVQLVERIAQTFGSGSIPPEIAVKRENTLELLAACLRAFPARVRTP